MKKHLFGILCAVWVVLLAATAFAGSVSGANIAYVTGGSASIEIPAKGADDNFSTPYYAVDSEGTRIPASRQLTWSITDDFGIMYPGVIDIPNNNGVVRVSYAAKDIVDGVEVKVFRVTARSNSAIGEDSVSVALVIRRAYPILHDLLMDGQDSATIALEGSRDVTVQCQALDQYEDALSDGVTWSVDTVSFGMENSGVTVDSNGLVTIAKDAKRGEYRVTAKREGVSVGPKTLTVTDGGRNPARVEIYSGQPGILIPGDGQDPATVTFRALVLDQFGSEITGQTVTWTITDSNGGTIPGITIDNGVVSVDNTVKTMIPPNNRNVMNIRATCGNVTSSPASIYVERAPSEFSKVQLNGMDSPDSSGQRLTFEYLNGQILNITATALDQYGSEFPGVPSWEIMSYTDKIGVAINTGGLITISSGAVSGEYIVRATYGNRTCSASFLIKKIASAATVLSRVTVSPSVVTLSDSVLTATATAYDANGVPVTSGVLWSVYPADNGVIISATGQIAISPNAIGRTYLITATPDTLLGTVSGIAQSTDLTVTAAPTLSHIALSSASVTVNGTTGGSSVARAYDANNREIIGVTWAVSPSRNGVFIDANGGNITVSSTAESGNYVVMASKDGVSRSAVLRVIYDAPADPAPTLESLSYAFPNSRAGFGYAQDYKIPYERYVYVFGNKVMTKVLFRNAGAWGGNCYGISTSAALFYQKDNQIFASVFRDGASVPRTLELSDKNGVWNLSLKEFIECMQVSQFSPDIQKAYRERRNQLPELCAAVSAFAENGQNPVVVAVFGPEGGHALLGYKIEKVSAAQSRLYVYDSNYPEDAERYLTLDTNATGKYQGWSYPINSRILWGSALPGCWISYVPYSDFYQVWQNRDKKGGGNLELLTVNDDARICDADGRPVASIQNGELITGRDDMFPLIDIGLTADGAEAGKREASVWIPADMYTVKRVASGGARLSDAEPFEASVTHMEQSAKISTTAGSVVFAVDDESQINMVSIEEGQEGETYDITLNSTLENAQNEEVRLTGTVLSKALTFMQVNGVARYSGITSGDGSGVAAGTTLTIDGQQFELRAVTNSLPVMSFNANGGAGSMSPRAVGDDGAMVMPSCEFVAPDGMEFDGWLVNGVKYRSGERCQLTENASASAQWKPVGVHTNASAYEIRNVAVDGANVNVEIANLSGNNAALSVAAYDENGKFLRVATKAAGVAQGDSGTITVALDASGAKSVKAFLLDADTQKPLCAGKSYDV